MIEYTFKNIATNTEHMFTADNEKKAWNRLRDHLNPLNNTWKDHWEIIITVISKRSEKLCLDQEPHSLGCKHRYLNLTEQRYLCYYMPDVPGKCSHIWYELYRKGENHVVEDTPLFSSTVKVESYLEEHNLDASNYEMREVCKP